MGAAGVTTPRPGICFSCFKAWQANQQTQLFCLCTHNNVAAVLTRGKWRTLHISDSDAAAMQARAEAGGKAP
jgi:hypothetical protein